MQQFSIHVLPRGYSAYAHTNDQKNIYLSHERLTREEEDYEQLLMSVVSLTHEIRYIKSVNVDVKNPDITGAVPRNRVFDQEKD